MTGFVLTEEEKQNLLQMALQIGCQFELKTAGGKKQKTKMEHEGREAGHDQWMCSDKDDDDKCGIPRRSISKPSSVSLVGCLSALSAM